MNGFQELNHSELYQIDGGSIGSWLRKIKKELTNRIINAIEEKPRRSTSRRTDLDHVGAYEP